MTKPKATCSADECSEPVRRGSFCRAHHDQKAWLLPEMILKRLWKKVDRSGGPDACWFWLGAKGGENYGDIRVDGKNRRVTASRP